MSGTPISVANYYVSTTGSDSNPGTFALPFATINKAASALRTLGCGTSSRLVYLMGGTYYGTSVNFTSADAATASCPTTYASYPSQTAILSGGTQLSSWSPVTTGTCAAAHTAGYNCWQAAWTPTTNLPERLYINGSPRQRPRIYATAAALQGTGYAHFSCASSAPNYPACFTGSFASNFTYSSADASVISNWSSCATNQCEVTSFNKWVANVSIISSINTSTRTITLTCTSNSNCPLSSGGPGPSFSNGFRFTIENVKELLQYQGQWYLDTTTNLVSYISYSSENPNNETVELGSSPQVLTTSVTSGTGCGGNGCSLAYTTFSGLQFEDDNFSIPSTGYVSTQNDPNLNGAAMVDCTACNNVNFVGDAFFNTTGTGLQFDGGSVNSEVTQSVFYDNGAYGLRFGVKASTSVCTPGSCTNQKVPNNMTASNNWIGYSSRYFPSADCVMLGLTNNDTLNNNDVSYCYDKGFEICMPDSHTCSSGSATDFNITINNNAVHNIGQGVMTDLAGIYAATESGTGNIVEDNLIHDVNGSTLNGDTSDVGVHGIYLDDQTGLWTVFNNVVYRVLANLMHMNAGPQSSGQQNTITNNIFVNSANDPTGNGACVGIQSPAGAGVLSYKYQSNLCYQDQATSTKVNWGKGPLQSAPNTTQNFVTNLYQFAGTPSFTMTNGSGGQTAMSFATWQSNSEDVAGTITNTAGFTAPTGCANTIPNPGVCDDFTFLNHTGPGFGFVYSAQSYGPPSGSVPTVIATFPEATLPVSQF